MPTNPHNQDESPYYAWKVDDIYNLNDMYESMTGNNDFLLKNAEIHSIYELDKPADPNQQENKRLTEKMIYYDEEIASDQLKRIQQMAVRIEYLLSNPTPEIEQIMWKHIAILGKECKIHMKEITLEIFERAGINVPALLLTVLVAIRSDPAIYTYSFNYEISRGDPKTILEIILFNRFPSPIPDEIASYRKQKNYEPGAIGLSHNHIIAFEESYLSINDDLIETDAPGIPETVKLNIIGKNIRDIIESPFLPDVTIHSYNNHPEFEMTVGHKDPRFEYQPICNILLARGYIR